MERPEVVSRAKYLNDQLNTTAGILELKRVQ